MGCLKNLIRAIIIALAVVGFLSLGGRDWVIKYVDQWINPSQEVMLERAKKVGDFSSINEEFELEKATGMLGYNGVVAEHKATGQKLIVIDSNKKPLLTKDDIQSEQIEEKLKSIISKVKYQALSVDELKITKRGNLYSYGQNAPYVKFNAKISKLPIGEICGIISVTATKDGESRMLISANEKAKYSQLISEEFFKEIK